MADPYYITTAISYPNGRPHIGHAYELIATDALARFQRLDGRDVFFLTGTDEHGIKMLQTARAQGMSPRELADRKILAGVSLGRLYPGEQALENGLVVAVTETTTPEDVEALATGLTEVLA